MTTTGITTAQMQTAPHGAVYVWANQRTLYAMDLAKALRRTDLRIIGPLDLLRWKGGKAVFVIDHAARLTVAEAAVVAAFRVRK